MIYYTVHENELITEDNPLKDEQYGKILPVLPFHYLNGQLLGLGRQPLEFKQNNVLRLPFFINDKEQAKEYVQYYIEQKDVSHYVRYINREPDKIRLKGKNYETVYRHAQVIDPTAAHVGSDSWFLCMFGMKKAEARLFSWISQFIPINTLIAIVNESADTPDLQNYSIFRRKRDIGRLITYDNIPFILLK